MSQTLKSVIDVKSKSPIRVPCREYLSRYAGPIPWRVVPILESRVSSSIWNQNTTCVRLSTKINPSVFIPCACKSRISSTNFWILTTHPNPI